MNRRRFLPFLFAAAAAATVWPVAELAAEPEKVAPQQTWARLRFRAERNDDDDWNVHPNADLNLIEVINRNTTLNVEPKWYVADVASLEEMVQHPFLFMHAELPPTLSDAERANLREYLLRGGFLFAEDCVNGKGRTAGWPNNGDVFFQRMRKELPRIVPEAKFELLPNSHPIFHNVFGFKDGMPRMQGRSSGLWALTLNGRVLALLSPCDIHCGWANGDQWFHPGAAAIALRMGVNIYVFAMTQGE